MRLFIAVNFSGSTKNALLALRDKLESRAERGSFTTEENLHITLVFLSECGMKQVSAVKTAMDIVNFEPFEILIERVGRFGRGGQNESLWWAGARENTALLGLQRDLTDNLAAAGFALDSRRFSPHITLGRRVVTDALPWRTELFGETIQNIDLMKSERINGRLTYTPIYTKTAI